jgi:hypothetical protein
MLQKTEAIKETMNLYFKQNQSDGRSKLFIRGKTSAREIIK